MKKKFKYIFVVLVYKNYDDFQDFYYSIQDKVDDCRVVIVNSEYSEDCTNYGKKMANDLDCDFISVKNKGYGFGNNCGIKFVSDNYIFDYLIISNPDIELKKFSDKEIEKYKECIIGPKIITLSGKNQNPYYFKKNWISFSLLRRYAKSSLYIYRIMYLLFNKFDKSLKKMFSSGKEQVYALHGSFFICHKDAIKKLSPLYDERMFLYSEEVFLANKAEKESINMYYDSDIEIIHKEDGSSEGVDTRKHGLESLKILFEHMDE